MSDKITINKFVELTYKIIDQSNDEIIEQVEDPLGYVQGDNSLLGQPSNQRIRRKIYRGSS